MDKTANALKRLIDGNHRYASGDAQAPQVLQADLVAGQRPFAVVLGCSDSRVPVEMIFDQGPGELFVIRVAGNIVAPSQVGSVEFAAEQFGVRLVVVLGHNHCGAIEATLAELNRPTESRSPNLRSIVDRIRPAVEELMTESEHIDEQSLRNAAVRANIRVAADHLRHGSQIIERLIARQGLAVVGAEYCLETGKVAFFDGVDEMLDSASG